MAEYTSPGEPVKVADGPLFGYVVHFEDGHTLDGTTVARDKADAEQRVRAWLLIDPGVRGIAEVWGDPGKIEVRSVEEYLRQE
jgi:hypothetical protein